MGEDSIFIQTPCQSQRVVNHTEILQVDWRVRNTRKKRKEKIDDPTVHDLLTGSSGLCRDARNNLRQFCVWILIFPFSNLALITRLLLMRSSGRSDANQKEVGLNLHAYKKWKLKQNFLSQIISADAMNRFLKNL